MDLKYDSIKELREQISKIFPAMPRLRKRSVPSPEGPVVFVAQPEYFRSTYYDAISDGENFEYHIKSSNRTSLERLPEFIEKNEIRICIIFRPEWFLNYPHIFQKLKDKGIYMVGYSTEPIPLDGEETDIHFDKKIRLNSVLDSLYLDYDLFIHYEKESLGLLKSLGFRNLISHPLPVSRKIYYPEKLDIDFDICFLGRSTEYREKIMGPLKCEFDIVHIAHGLIDNDARDMMNRSRAVLNIHNYDYPNFETRVPTALFCNKPVFSDLLSGDLLLPGKDYILYGSAENLYNKFVDFKNNKLTVSPEVDLSLFHVEKLLDLIRTHIKRQPCF